MNSTVYLDHAATTPMLDEAVAAMMPVLRNIGNAASLHSSGRHARRLLEESRESIAANLGARPSEVVFTGGGTEANNLAIKGIYWARRKTDASLTRIVSTKIEHHAVLDPLEWLTKAGADVTYLDVDAQGRVNPDDLRSELERGGVALVSVMWANNEVGTIQPIDQLASIANEFGVPMHSDAIAAAGHIPLDFGASGLAALSIAAHKFGGPQGTGALLIARDCAAVPLLHGGGHERDLRSGTPDTASVVGMAAALTTSVSRLVEYHNAMLTLRHRLIEGVRSHVTEFTVNGAHTIKPIASPADATAERVAGLPSIVHVSFDGCEGDSLLMLLDAQGIECSTGSACTAGVASASHVLIAMGADTSSARGSLRFSLGPETTTSDIDQLIEALPQVIARARAAGMANAR